MPNHPDIWTVKAALDWCRGYLEKKGDDNPRLSAEWLLSEATGLRRVELYVNFDRPLSSDERATLRDFVARRGAGEPLQYITGEVAFRHIVVKVRPGVLIPRPETEVLVSEALSLLPSQRRRHALDSELTESEAEVLLAKAAMKEDADGFPAFEREGERSSARSLEDAFAGDEDAFAADVSDAGSPDAARKPSGDEAQHANAASGVLYVADICTGSGCIACSIAYERPDARVLASDISADALALARDNVSALGLDGRVHVLASDLGRSIPERFMGKLDLVVSNPPYVPTAVMADIPREVAAFEPSLALDGGEDGLDLFRPLTAWAREALKPGGGYAVELHETCLEAAASIAREAGFEEVRIANDLAGRPRVLVARAPR